jgi:hypothetical protein
MQFVFLVVDDDRSAGPDEKLSGRDDPASTKACDLARQYGCRNPHWRVLTVEEKLAGFLYIAKYLNDGKDIGSTISVRKVEVQ